MRTSELPPEKFSSGDAGKIRVMTVFSRLNVGGPSVITILLTSKLNNREFEAILVKGSEDPNEGNMLYLAEEHGVEPVLIPEMGRKISFISDIIALFKLYSLISEYKPHVIHTHTAKAGTLGRVAAIVYNLSVRVKKIFNSSCKGREAKVFHTFHGHVFNSYFNPLVTKVFISIERLLALTTDRIITVSEKQREEILSYGVGVKERVMALPIGLPLVRFLDIEMYKGCLRKELGFSKDTVLVGIVARLVPVKNHCMFVDVVKRLASAANIKFLVIGDGEQRERVLQQVQERKLGNMIKFLRFRKDLEKVYADLDIVVLTSLNEGSPVALIEGMAAAKPVISTDVGGVRDLFSDGVEGFKVPSGDAEMMAGRIRLLAADRELRISMGRKGRKRVYPAYDIDTLVNGTAALYKEFFPV